MIVGAAVCPGAPFLIGGTADAIAARLDAVVAACSVAVSRLTGADAMLLITSAAGAAGPPEPEGCREFGPGTIISTSPVRRSDLRDSRGVALSSAVAAPAAASSAATPAAVTAAMPAVGTMVGAVLLATSQLGAVRDGTAPELRQPPTTAIEITGDPAEVAGKLAPRAASAERIALLVIADGSACHGDDAPGRRDDRAVRYDAALAEALAAGDPAALGEASADRDLGRALLATTDPLMVLALLTEQRPPSSAELLYFGAPLGVGYLVASWRWAAG